MTTTASVRDEIEAELRAEREAEVERRVAERQNAEAREVEAQAAKHEAEKTLSLAGPALIEAQSTLVGTIATFVEALESAQIARDTYDAAVRVARRTGVQFEAIPEIGVQSAASTDEGRALRALLRGFYDLQHRVLP